MAAEPFRLDHHLVQAVLRDQPCLKPWPNQGETVAASGRTGHAACRRDHLLVSAIVISDPATTAGAHPAGPPPGPDGSNKTNLGPNRARTKENERWEGAASRTQKHTLRGALHLAIGSASKPPLQTTTSHP
ncbi:hypothetical protein F511_16399 [Dorcoceras hygrometricum]|uniref:Uncharacterized protein n=1 Tax=Dorcoceras hygrometricum TaxID=472368 RepID=A0A2Z7BEF1_9LAMI|nr:hypothetical protein F511_16399 [Dorcoceras hygrometricum]